MPQNQIPDVLAGALRVVAHQLANAGMHAILGDPDHYYARMFNQAGGPAVMRYLTAQVEAQSRRTRTLRPASMRLVPSTLRIGDDRNPTLYVVTCPYGAPDMPITRLAGGSRLYRVTFPRGRSSGVVFFPAY